MSRYSLPESICEGLCNKSGRVILPKRMQATAQKTPVETYWAKLNHEQREHYRRAYDFNGPFETVLEYAYSEKGTVTP